MRKIAAIVQARMGSRRLPGKVMLDICGRPLLWHVITRIRNIKGINEIILATSTSEQDKVLLEVASSMGVKGFAGSEEDVLDRYYRAAEKYSADIIVRITADDPFKDPVVTHTVISTYLDNLPSIDYVSNWLEPTFPVGLDVEVFSFESLEIAFENAKEQKHREHVTTYIWQNPQKFRLMNVDCSLGNLSSLRWTVDTQEDLDFVRGVYGYLYEEGKIFFMQDILELLGAHPELKKINSDVEQKQV
jgi:spore coat polysaccharide biosynthesis protein SpsF